MSGMAKRSKQAGVAVEASGPVSAGEELEQARGSEVPATGADLAGLAAREADGGARAAVQALGYPVAQEGRAVAERRERARKAVDELATVVAHRWDRSTGEAVVRALRAVVAAL